jgi:hypothetical protein
MPVLAYVLSVKNGTMDVVCIRDGHLPAEDFCISKELRPISRTGCVGGLGHSGIPGVAKDTYRIE